MNANTTIITDTQITTAETWGYGFLCVTIISAASPIGALVIPFRNSKIYKKVLMVMIGIAVGCLSGSGFLHLFPEALEITDDPDKMYVWKGVMLMGGLYLFYLVEKILSMILLKKRSKKVLNNEALHSDLLELENSLMDDTKNSVSHAHSHNLPTDLGTSIAPVAWMIILGDGLHNFIDGLSIGAAFTQSTLQGVNICIAVACEEFPHELGDFAILVHAGMTYRQALFYNFLSACMCYLGLVLGILIGDDLNKWIYALAAGMFIFIGLSQMLPELNHMGDELEGDYAREKGGRGEISFAKKFEVLFLQNVGILVGFTIMLVTALYGDRLEF